MASVELYNPQEPTPSSALSNLQLLQLTRPSYKCRFVRQGDTFHLLVYLNQHAKIPFLRVPADSLYQSALEFIGYENAI
ncbi:hypothetical protein ACODM8_14455 [Vibrio ostreicida]|uniref:hypothetical protein n=1 Tax=Vibrio ostreicida TaxID=526588 RepID=UPI003B5B64D6